MTHQADVAGSRDVVARWCALAEQRLEYLTELFETGRWRRYHSEIAFLENIQEAKAAVEVWRALSTGQTCRTSSAGGISWPGRPRTPLPPTDIFSGNVPRPPPAPLRAEFRSRHVLMAGEAVQVCADEAPSAPYSDAPAMHMDPILDPAAAQTMEPDFEQDLKQQVLEQQVLEQQVLEEQDLDRQNLEQPTLDPVLDRLTRDIAAIAERYPLLRNVM